MRNYFRTQMRQSTPAQPLTLAMTEIIAMPKTTIMRNS